jgi:hypothetical protein
MADQRGTLELLADELGSALVAIKEVVQIDRLSEFFLELGLDNPPLVAADPQFVQKLADAGTQCAALAGAIDDLVETSDQGDTAATIEAIARVFEAIARLLSDLDAVATDLRRATANSSDAATIAAFAEEMVKRLLEAAVVRYLEETYPVIERILAFLTVVEVTPLPLRPPPPPPPASNDASDAVADDLQVVPLGFARTAYGWGDEAFDGKRLFASINDLFDALGLFALVDEDVSPPTLSFLRVSLSPTRDVHPPGLEGGLYVDMAESADLVLAQLTEEWKLRLRLTGTFQAGLGIQILPPASIVVTPPTSTLEEPTGPLAPAPGGVRFALRRESDAANPFVLLALPGGSRLEAKQIEASIGGAFSTRGSNGTLAADVLVDFAVMGGVAVLALNGADGFLSELLPEG